MMAKRHLVAALFCLLQILPVIAHAQSLEELTAQIDSETSEISGFRALLTDPDPSRALAAMRVMLRSDDPVLVNLALEAGLNASNGVMRKIALERYIAGRPNLVATAKLVEEGGNAAKFANWMDHNDYAMTSTTTGYIAIPVPPYIEEQNCFGVQNKCYVRIAADTLSVLLGTNYNPNWGALELMDGGKLVGSVLGYGNPIELEVDLLGSADQ